MFCGQCGKRVLDTMLFCPFCGSPIVIPDQDGDEPIEPIAPESTELLEEESGEPEPEFAPLRLDAEPEPEAEAAPAGDAPEPDGPVSLFDAGPEDEDFAPLNLDEPEPEDMPPEDLPEEVPAEEPSRPHSPAKRRPEGSASIRSRQTYIPVKNVDPNDMFMDGSHPDPEDEYDPYDDDGDDGDGYKGGFRFEEPEQGGFLQRHIRGVVGLILLAMLLVIFAIWAIMPKGQQLLATANLAWKAETYNDLGYDAYEAGQFHQAATYFERALARDEGNYEYAHSAMVAYYEAEELDSAFAMLKKCIEMHPDDPEPYHELLILYPNSEGRPWEAQELLRLGYERTGDAALNPGGE